MKLSRGLTVVLAISMLPILARADCGWNGATIMALGGTNCAAATVPGDLSSRPVGMGLLLGKVGLWLGTNDSYGSSAYFGLQKAPTGYVNDFALVGSADPGTYRWLRIGYNAGDNPNNAFNSKVAINTFTGQMTMAGSLSTGGPLSIGDVGGSPAMLAVQGDISPRPLGLGVILGKVGMYLATNDAYNSGAYFGFQKAPVGFESDFALVGSADAFTQRYLRIGYNDNDNPSQPFHSKAAINVITGDATFAGTVSGANVKANYQDVAEWVPATEAMTPGTVVVVEEDASNTVAPSSRAYDTRVAGIVSAQPGVLLGVEGASKAKVATTGRVKVRVDATRGAIRAGDLLVTSDKPGVAMRSEPVDFAGVKMHRPGTLIGKALEPLPSGQGEILVLLSLQ